VSIASPPAAALRGGAKQWLRAALPLPLRQRAAAWVGRQRWIARRDWYATELVRDLAEHDVNAFHRFLWANHLGYARTYEVAERFGAERVHPSRLVLFDDLHRVLSERGVRPEQDVRSVLEVGCSMGYLLRHAEEHLFAGAEVLEGFDIDAYAVREGAEELRRAGSRVRLEQGDMAELPRLAAGRTFDVVLCAGVLMYLRQEDAARVVREMLAHCGGLVVLAGLAHPSRDNARLEGSVPRGTDQSLIHNLDAMVAEAGGRVVFRRWEGGRSIQGNTIYFVFAEPGGVR
jgi:SAM-dependent methyltransferase